MKGYSCYFLYKWNKTYDKKKIKIFISNFIQVINFPAFIERELLLIGSDLAEKFGNHDVINQMKNTLQFNSLYKNINLFY